MAYAVKNVGQPLVGFANRGIFKVYAPDVGLLGALAKIPAEVITRKHELFTTYNGAFVENYAAQQLVASGQDNLYYWKSDSSKAEVDFLYERASSIFPLEVKAGINPKSKSLWSYDNRFHPKVLVGSTLLNLKKDNRMVNIPLYAINYLKRLIAR